MIVRPICYKIMLLIETILFDSEIFVTPLNMNVGVQTE